MKNRHGFTMIELLVVISVISVILPLAGSTIFFLLRAQSQSAEALRDAMATTQLSHTLRSDIHAARTAASSGADEVSLEIDDARIIEYRCLPDGFVSRVVRRGTSVERRERFRVGDVRPRFKLAQGGREVAVTISPRLRGGVPLEDRTSAAGIRIAAMVGRDLGSSAAQSNKATVPQAKRPQSAPSPKERTAP
jgi:prepilin-type N-terminal cleavage/methylation domain-containing protein